MPRIDAFDEALIDASPPAVYRVILNEAARVTHWWMPYWESKQKGNIPIDSRVLRLTQRFIEG